MLDKPGIYIGGDHDSPGVSIVIFSNGKRLIAMSIDNELAPDRFLDGFHVKHGPFQP